MSDIKDYIKYAIKRQGTLPTNAPFYIYINRIKKRLVFNKNMYITRITKP